MVKYLALFFAVSFFVAGPVFAQKAVLKTNTLYWLTGTPNLGAELKLGKTFSLDVSGNYHPFKFKEDKAIKHWLIQPELCYWPCKAFKGHFVGLHGHYAGYNVSWKDYRYEGNLFGGGISYGYQWLLSVRWSIEAEIGVGYSRLRYDKFECRDCGAYIGSGHKNYVGPTRAAVNFIYVLK